MVNYILYIQSKDEESFVKQFFFNVICFMLWTLKEFDSHLMNMSEFLTYMTLILVY